MAIEVQLEVGKQKVFAVAVAWPGWARSAKDEDGALETLLDYADRYRASLGATASKGLPKRLSLDVVSRVKGDSGTDYGVPSKPCPGDDEPLKPAQLARQLTILRASWRAFDLEAKRSHGKVLATGPRGGGRTLAKMADHVVDSEGAYLRMVGGEVPKGGELQAVRSAFLDAVEARNRGELPDRGPRGGRRWTAAEAIRRSAWHALDHAWELADRR